MSEAALTIREALANEQLIVSGLIEAVGLSAAGVFTAGSRYWLASVNEVALGTLGLELGTDAAARRRELLRPRQPQPALL